MNLLGRGGAPCNIQPGDIHAVLRNRLLPQPGTPKPEIIRTVEQAAQAQQVQPTGVHTTWPGTASFQGRGEPENVRSPPIWHTASARCQPSVPTQSQHSNGNLLPPMTMQAAAVSVPDLGGNQKGLAAALRDQIRAHPEFAQALIHAAQQSETKNGHGRPDVLAMSGAQVLAEGAIDLKEGANVEASLLPVPDAKLDENKEGAAHDLKGSNEGEAIVGAEPQQLTTMRIGLGESGASEQLLCGVKGGCTVEGDEKKACHVQRNPINEDAHAGEEAAARDVAGANRGASLSHSLAHLQADASGTEQAMPSQSPDPEDPQRREPLARPFQLSKEALEAATSAARAAGISSEAGMEAGIEAVARAAAEVMTQQQSRIEAAPSGASSISASNSATASAAAGQVGLTHCAQRAVSTMPRVYQYDLGPGDDVDACFRNLRRRIEVELDDGSIVQMCLASKG